MSEITERPTTAASYGSPMSRNVKIAAVSLLVIAIAVTLGWLVWVAVYHANPAVRGTLLGYDVTSDRSVEVRFEVWRKPGVTAQCVVRARNAEGVEVGSRVITIPPGERRVVLTQVLETRARAINGELQSCQEAATG